MNVSIDYKKYSLRIILTAVAITSGAAGIWFAARNNQSDAKIYPFNEQRDTPFILDLFRTNMYWLYDGPAESFSPERILSTRSSSTRPEHYNNLTIKVLYKKDVPVGFVAYHKLTFAIAKLLFLAIKDEFRGQRYGYLLLQDAINDMRTMGYKKVRLITRTNNESSQNLYTKFGFHQTYVEDGIVTFEYDL